MQWVDVSTELKAWRIPETKQGKPQFVPLVDEALAILEVRKTTSNSPFVFPAHSAKGYIADPMLNWKRILKKAGIEGLRIHDLRRTFGS
jgi:integrase